MADAEKYLTAAWNLDQFGGMGDHLGHLYEKTGNKQQAIHFYALALATGLAPDETRDRLVALLGSKARADEAVKAALGDLGQSRTVKLPRVSRGQAKAEFFVLFTRGAGVASVRFISGSDELRDVSKAIMSADYQITFPDDRPVKLVRRGILNCESGSSSCEFVLFTPHSVNSLN